MEKKYLRTKVKAKWAKKLIKSKSFLVVTDTESAMYLEDVNSDSIVDQITFVQQKIAVESFIEALQDTLKQIDEVGAAKFGIAPKKSRKKTSKKTK